MASLQEQGLVRLYAVSPEGNKTLIGQDSVIAFAPGGGAPDATATGVKTPDTWITINSNVILANDWILQVTFDPDVGGDGLDVSDMIWRIPVVTPAGSKALGTAQFQNPALADLTLVAGEQVIGGYKVIEGSLKVAGRIFLDMQDDT